MDKKDMISALEFVSTTQRKEVYTRRIYEWKIIFTVLTFDVLTAGAAIKLGTDLSGSAALVWRVYLGLTIISIIYLQRLYRNNRLNKDAAHKAEHAVVAILAGRSPSAAELAVYHGCVESAPKANSEERSPNREDSCSGEDRSRNRLARLGLWFWGWPWGWFWQALVLLMFGVAAAYLVSFNWQMKRPQAAMQAELSGWG